MFNIKNFNSNSNEWKSIEKMGFTIFCIENRIHFYNVNKPFLNDELYYFDYFTDRNEIRNNEKNPVKVEDIEKIKAILNIEI